MSLASCFFPTQVVLLDDNPRFLESMSIALGKKNVFKLFRNPNEVITYLTSQAEDPFTKRCLLRPEEMERDHRIIDVDISAISKEIYNPKRFLETTVLVLDYTMPSMHGVDVCKALKHLPVKKILLTGEANDKIAIDAFNQGLIDKFIRKGDKTAQVLDCILELQRKYFSDLSMIIIDSLTKNPEYPPSCLDDPIFLHFFNDFSAQINYAEFYLLDAMGSFLFLDENANATFLIVKDAEGMQSDFELADLRDTSVSPALLSALEKKEKLLYFYQSSSHHLSTTEFEQYAYPVKKLEGKETYYYSVVKNPHSFECNKNKILSYEHYLRSL